jgi:hypothetical protein
MKNINNRSVRAVQGVIDMPDHGSYQIELW